MRICVFGAGAVGGLIAARLHRAGVEVSLVARGETLAAIQAEGLSVQDRTGCWVARPRTGLSADLGPQDVIILATKAHALPSAIESVRPLLGPETSVVSAVNGLPWWYFHDMPKFEHIRHLSKVDPGGKIWNAVEPKRAIGCVVHLGASAPAPGRIKHSYGLQLVLGEPSGATTARLRAIVGVLDSAGFKSRASPAIRVEVWKKLWYNMAINPVSVLAGAPCDRISACDELMRLMTEMIEEAGRIAKAMAIDVPLDPREQVKGFAAIGAFKTSMLQDLEAGRPIELDPVLGALAELAGHLHIQAPRINEIYALAQVRAEAAGCYTPLSSPTRTSA